MMQYIKKDRKGINNILNLCPEKDNRYNYIPITISQGLIKIIND